MQSSNRITSVHFRRRCTRQLTFSLLPVLSPIPPRFLSTRLIPGRRGRELNLEAAQSGLPRIPTRRETFASPNGGGGTTTRLLRSYPKEQSKRLKRSSRGLLSCL